jgi:hypothetical protein
MSEDTDSEEEECSKNEECKNPEQKKSIKEEQEEKDYNSEEDENFNDANFIKSMKEGKYRDKHFRRFSKQNDGIEFTAFDLREENEEGHFDKNMNYIPNKEEYDPWYESVKDEVRQKELLKHKREKDEKDSDEKSENDDDNDNDEEYSKYGDEDLYYKEEKITKEENDAINKEIKINRVKLISLLIDEKETVKQAINRLKKENSKDKIKNKNNKNKKIKKEKNSDNNENDKFNILLNIVSKLTELSFFDVYSDTIDKIAKDYGKEYTFLWKYKIIESNETKKESIYGQYDTCTMKEWIKQKYFESTDEDNTTFLFLFEDKLDKNNIDANKWFNKEDALYKKYLNTDND